MLGVFMWCFLVPAATSAIILIGVKTGLLPSRLRSVVDSLILIFPILYALYILGSEMLAESRTTSKRGSLQQWFRQILRDATWRKEKAILLRTHCPGTKEDYRWLL